MMMNVIMVVVMQVVSNWRWSEQKSESKDEKSILGVWLVFTKLISKKKSSAKCYLLTKMKTRSSWFNCALRDDKAVYWVSIEHYEAVAVGN